MALALGMTVSEAKRRMTYREALQWGAYFQKHGYASQTSGAIPEIQRGFALLASILINVNGGYKGGNKAKIEDFLPGEKTDQEGDFGDVAALLSSLSGGNGDKPARKLWRRASKKVD